MKERCESKFVDVKELAGILESSESKAYKVLQQLNDELKKKGMIVVAGKVSRRYLEERIYI